MGAGPGFATRAAAARRLLKVGQRMCRRLAPTPALAAVFALASLGACSESLTQLGDLSGATQQLSGWAPVSSVLDGDPPITTSLSDAVFDLDLADPRDLAGPRSLLSLERTPQGGFVLAPGLYEMHTQSYCLKAGTHGPGGGDGYLYAPPKGPARDAVVAIVRNSVAHPRMQQHDIQLLLWAIIARAKFEDLAPELKVVAGQLLTPQQMVSLNRSALDLVPGPALDSALARTPAVVRQVLEAEARMRQLLTHPGSSYGEIEAVAVLAGMVGLGPESRDVPSGRWSKHPDGYYVRYLPRAYSHTLTQIWVPERSPAVGREYDPALHIAVPGNTSRQRLIQSGRSLSP
jgi:hypothetical protein